MLRDDEALAAIEQDFTRAHQDGKLSVQRFAMLSYACKLTRTPQSMKEDDVTALRAAGFEDRDILEIAEVTAYYAYVNRIADGLGVVLDDYAVEE